VSQHTQTPNVAGGVGPRNRYFGIAEAVSDIFLVIRGCGSLVSSAVPPAMLLHWISVFNTPRLPHNL